MSTKQERKDRQAADLAAQKATLAQWQATYAEQARKERDEARARKPRPAKVVGGTVVADLPRPTVPPLQTMPLFAPDEYLARAPRRDAEPVFATVRAPSPRLAVEPPAAPVEYRDAVRGIRVAIDVGDIVIQEVDAIVNAANEYLFAGGGVSGAIHAAGGYAIIRECQDIIEAIGMVDAGSAVTTRGGRLPAKFVIHAVGPRMGADDEALLQDAVRSVFLQVREFGLRSVALPLISTGIFGVPLETALPLYFAGLFDGLALQDGTVREVRVIVRDAATHAACLDAYLAARRQATGR